MDTILQRKSQVICYLDHILTTGKSDTENMSNLKQIQRLKEHEVRLNKDKCHLFEDVVEYLVNRVDCTRCAYLGKEAEGHSGG